MTDYQRGVHAGLMIGTPALAALYRVVVENPGIHIRAIHATGVAHASERVLTLERARLIQTRRVQRNGRRARGCYAAEEAA